MPISGIQSQADKVNLLGYAPCWCLGGGGGSVRSAYSFFIWAPDGMCGQCQAPAALFPPVPIVPEAGWTTEPVWMQRQKEKSYASVGDRTGVVQAVRHHADWATRCTMWLLYVSLVIKCLWQTDVCIQFVYWSACCMMWDHTSCN
jgi:hypothetical protein